jgi:phosphate-selective porin
LNTTSTPEGVGRLRFHPWRNTSNEWLKGLAIGGAFSLGKSGPNSNSFGALLPDGTLTFFKADPINGPVTRANGDFTWTKGPFALSGEYDQLNQFRHRLGARSTNLRGVVGKGYYAAATYLLTGERKQENAQPKPRHTFLMGEHGVGAWELKFRYANLLAADGRQENRVDEFSSGINWYPNSFVRYMIDFNVERLKNPVSSPVALAPQTFLSVIQRVQFRF